MSFKNFQKYVPRKEESVPMSGNFIKACLEGLTRVWVVWLSYGMQSKKSKQKRRG